ncbi:MAG: hypothetical protein P4L51_18510 [Puia sp.]|nr:hypothetical protein [Puia sp.]
MKRNKYFSAFFPGSPDYAQPSRFALPVLHMIPTPVSPCRLPCCLPPTFYASSPLPLRLVSHRCSRRRFTSPLPIASPLPVYRAIFHTIPASGPTAFPARPVARPGLPPQTRTASLFAGLHAPSAFPIAGCFPIPAASRSLTRWLQHTRAYTPPRLSRCHMSISVHGALFLYDPGTGPRCRPQGGTCATEVFHFMKKIGPHSFLFEFF